MKLEPGTRVQLHPACDEWMQGDGFGIVVDGGSRMVIVDGVKTQTHYRILLDKSGRTRRFHADNVIRDN
jgi:hypothetical protein